MRGTRLDIKLDVDHYFRQGEFRGVGAVALDERIVRDKLQRS